MKCHLCGSERQLVQAHIIPKPFFVARDKQQRVKKVISNAADTRPKRLPAGFYDPNILCGDCDNTIGIWDQYGVQLLVNELEQLMPAPLVGEPVVFRRPSFQYDRLRLFFLSVLWRANASSLPMFVRVSLGSRERRLREMIRKADPGDPEEFCTLLSAFTVDGKLPPTGLPIMDPFAELWNGVNAYRVSFGVITAYIKVDEAPFPNTFSQLALRSGEPLQLVARDFATSSEADVMRAIARAPQNRGVFNSKSDHRDHDA